MADCIKSVRWFGCLAFLFSVFVSSSSRADELLSANEIAALSTAQKMQLVQLLEPLQQANALYEQGKYQEFLPRAEGIYRGLVEVFGAEHRISALALTLRGGALAETGNPSAAKKYLDDALKIQLKRLGEVHLETAQTRFLLGETERLLGHLDAATEQLQLCLKTRLKLLGAANIETAEAMTRMGHVELAHGRGVSALSFMEEALTNQRRALGDQSPVVATTYSGIGLARYVRGDYLEAREAMQRSLAIRRKALGEQHVDTGRSHYWLGVIQQAMGDTASAITAMTQAYSVFVASFGKQHETTLSAMQSLGEMHQSNGDLKRAEAMLSEALQGQLAVSGPKHLSSAIAGLSLGRLRQHEGRLDEAELLYVEAAKIYKTILEPNNPQQVVPLLSLVQLSLERRNYDEASQQASRIIELLRQSDFSEVGDLPASLTDLAIAQWKTDKPDKCMISLDDARHQIRRMAIKTLPGLTEREILLCMKHVDESLFNRALEIGYRLRDVPGMVDKSADWVVNGKGMIEESLIRQSRSQRAEKQATEAGLHDEEWIEHTYVREVLPENSLMVDIVRLDPNGNKSVAPWPDPSKSHYVAWLLASHRDRNVKVVDLGQADEIDKLVRQARQKLVEAAPHGESPGSITELGDVESMNLLSVSMTQLSERLLKPFESELIGVENLYISPDASLWLVPWNALPLDKDTFLIEKFTTQYLVTSRDLLHSGNTEIPFSTSVLFADPNFDLQESARAQATKAVLRKNPPASDAVRAFKASKDLPKALRLPGTAMEAELIKPTLATLSRSDPILYSDSYALESVFKALHSPQYLVMSTHGFFLDDVVAQHHAGFNSLGSGFLRISENQPMPVVQGVSNPLSRCGLMLAGCNIEGKVQSSDDGILTGQEIAQSDLAGTRLVVLSACDTGLGDVRNGDGVAGLRQAFRLAGARAVVASLWQIPDRESAILMNGFFQHAASNTGYAKALREAQIERIEARRKRFGAAHPFYWAAWTLTGD